MVRCLTLLLLGAEAFAPPRFKAPRCPARRVLPMDEIRSGLADSTNRILDLEGLLLPEPSSAPGDDAEFDLIVGSADDANALVSLVESTDSHFRLSSTLVASTDRRPGLLCKWRGGAKLEKALAVLGTAPVDQWRAGKGEEWLYFEAVDLVNRDPEMASIGSAQSLAEAAAPEPQTTREKHGSTKRFANSQERKAFMAKQKADDEKAKASQQGWSLP
ncbi:hypothetical protein M885DRAFT_528661 [Pelagophyceae sp. CCMP2097]|nr:hypothetical protein M885DRAFT_528661 [Pelagophyceae sp. CCMP2097]